MTTNKVWSRLLQSTALVGVAALATPAMAQDDDTDTIVVTGTLIKRQDIKAPSPVTSVSAEELKVVNTVNTEDFLNTLPQAIPGFDATSNNPGDGVATANLRGLGAQRTLVLVEGRRMVPYDPNGIVDLNQIPAALIERTDVVTGGASALYGSDAMAGVVNFDLRDDFQGLELNTSYDVTEQGDGDIFQTSIIAGGDFADGRGNATFFASYTDRQPVFQGDRDFSAVANGDALVGEPYPPTGSSGVPGTRLFDSFDFSSLAGYTPGATACSGPGAEGLDADCVGGATFDADGNPIPWINSGQNTTRYNYAPVNYLQLPQERYNLAAFANYQLFDNTEVRLRGLYANNVVAQELAATPIFDSFVFSEDNPTITDGFRALLEDQGAFDPNNGEVDEYQVYIGRRMLEVGPRNSTRDQASSQWTLETETDLANGMFWTNYAQYARTFGALSQTGNVSRRAFQEAIDSGCDIFGEGALTQDCVDIVSRTGIIRNSFEQTIVGSQIAGDLFGIQSPMATNTVAFAAGVEFREERGDFQPDSVLGPDVAGFNQSAPISGAIDVMEGFAEFQVPLIEGMQGIDELSINGAVRVSDYSTVGTLNTYQVGGVYSPHPDLSFKASFNRAARAPNLAELFQPLVNGFPQGTDPCADGSGQQSICTAEGVPASSFGDPLLQVNSQIEGLFGGNADLEEEVADTFTVGMVAQPSFIDGLTVTVDYYNIEIEDVITTAPINTVLDGCYIEGNASLCDLVTRSGSGSIDFVELNNQNLALLTAEGVDVDADYTFDPADFGYSNIGTFSFRFVGTYRIEDGFQEQAGGYLNNCSGYFGGDYGRCGEPTPEWKHTAFTTWNMGDLSATLRWRYIGGVTADDAIDPEGDDSFRDFRSVEIDAFNYFDLSGNYQVTEQFNIAAGVTNLFDEEPPNQSDTYAEQANTWPATYDPLGRSYFVSATFNF